PAANAYKACLSSLPSSPWKASGRPLMKANPAFGFGLSGPPGNGIPVAGTATSTGCALIRPVPYLSARTPPDGNAAGDGTPNASRTSLGSPAVCASGLEGTPPAMPRMTSSGTSGDNTDTTNFFVVALPSSNFYTSWPWNDEGHVELETSTLAR